MDEVKVGDIVLAPGYPAPLAVLDVLRSVDHDGHVSVLASLEGAPGAYWPVEHLRPTSGANGVFDLVGSTVAVAAIDAALIAQYPHDYVPGEQRQRYGRGLWVWRCRRCDVTTDVRHTSACRRHPTLARLGVK